MRSKNFKLEELIPKNLIETVHPHLLWDMIDDKLIVEIDRLKTMFPNGTITINNYEWGGKREWSGIRTKGSAYYSEGSQHSLGKAFDMVFSDYDVDNIRDYILNNQGEFPNIGGVELDTSWLHIDTRPRVNNMIKTFYS